MGLLGGSGEQQPRMTFLQYEKGERADGRKRASEVGEGKRESAVVEGGHAQLTYNGNTTFS